MLLFHSATNQTTKVCLVLYSCSEFAYSARAIKYMSLHNITHTVHELNQNQHTSERVVRFVVAVVDAVPLPVGPALILRPLLVVHVVF